MEDVLWMLFFSAFIIFIIYFLMKYAAKNAIKEFYNETIKKDFINKKAFLESDIDVDDETLLLMKNHKLITEEEYKLKKKNI